MLETAHVPLLGIVENMSTFTCRHCGQATDVFRRGGGERMSRQLGVPFLGAIPLDADIVRSGDEGRPIVLEQPKSQAAEAYLAIATELAGRLEGATRSNLCELAAATGPRPKALKMSDLLPVDPGIAIRAETSLADPDTCKFAVSRMVHPGGPFLFDSKERAAGSPLIERLFGLPGVAHVLVVGHIVTVGKHSGAAWSGLKSQIGAAIRTQMLTGMPAIFEASRSASGQRTGDQVRAAVQDLLDNEVNRSIAGHGGKISIVDLRDGRLSISMGGGCQGCAASQVTLRQGFDVMVRKVAPEIVDIIDTTDHAAGKQPFYQRTEASHG